MNIHNFADLKVQHADDVAHSPPKLWMWISNNNNLPNISGQDISFLKLKLQNIEEVLYCIAPYIGCLCLCLWFWASVTRSPGGRDENTNWHFLKMRSNCVWQKMFAILLKIRFVSHLPHLQNSFPNLPPLKMHLLQYFTGKG